MDPLILFYLIDAIKKDHAAYLRLWGQTRVAGASSESQKTFRYVCGHSTIDSWYRDWFNLLERFIRRT